MKIILIILAIYFSAETIGYGIYEKNQNQNKIGAIAIFIISALSLILPNVIMFFR